MKRLFIGIPIRSEVVDRWTKRLQRDESLNDQVIKWTNPLNWHITLIFLGNSPESSILQLQNLIENSFADVSSFKTNLTGVGVFPEANRPKVLWIGVANLHDLIPAQVGLVNSLKQNGFIFDNKPLKPHLTLARIKNSAGRLSLDSLIDQYQNFDFGSVIIDRVILYESISTSDGPVYKPLFFVHLL